MLNMPSNCELPRDTALLTTLSGQWLCNLKTQNSAVFHMWNPSRKLGASSMWKKDAFRRNNHGADRLGCPDLPVRGGTEVA